MVLEDGLAVTGGAYSLACPDFAQLCGRAFPQPAVQETPLVSVVCTGW